MWTREMIKTRAKGVLKLNYWKAFLVSLVLLFAGTHGSGGGGSNNRNHFNNGISFNNDVVQFNVGLVDAFMSFAAFIASIAIVLAILRIFLGYMLEVGGRKFFIRAADGETNMGYLGHCFEKNRYFDVLVTMLLRSIYTFLWTLLLIIPGIIKSYAYRMVPYILADNPNIGCNRAIELSSEMTKGEKFDIFILDLSFIGWYLLGALALGIGILFVNPYADATNAELYLILRKNAIDKGLTSYEELNIYKAIE